MPTLEEWRVLLVEQAKAEGFIAPGVSINELEFGPLHDRLRIEAGSARQRTLTAFAGWLRGTRNRIAHLDVIDVARQREEEQLTIAALRDA